MKRNYFLTVLFAAALACLTGCDKLSGFVKSSKDNAEQTTNAPMVKVETSAGVFIITLQPDKAPKTVEQFLENVNNGIYNNSIVHNVIKDYEMLIGAIKPTSETGETSDDAVDENSKLIPNEATEENSNKQWTVAMLHDPEETKSDPVQFFINMKDNSELDAQPGGEASPDTCGYCVFGIVTDGFDTLKTINQTPVVEKGEFEFAPEPDIVIIQMSVLQ